MITDLFARRIAHAGHVDITIRLHELGPPTGEVGEAGGPARPFVGWLGLLALLDDLLQPQAPAEVPPSAVGELDP